MTIELQSAALRAMRAFLRIDQDEAAASMGIGQKTLIDAERGRSCTAKTWGKALAFYETRGLYWRGGDGIEPCRILIAP